MIQNRLKIISFSFILASHVCKLSRKLDLELFTLDPQPPYTWNSDVSRKKFVVSPRSHIASKPRFPDLYMNMCPVPLGTNTIITMWIKVGHSVVF